MSIVLEQLTRVYGKQRVVDNVSLEVTDGELFVLLGSSGSGKSTILRLIAGLITPHAGRVLLHGKDVTNLPPQERGTGFVFQNYSIFRHMTVSENIEFGLKIRKTPKDERKSRRERLLDTVGLAGLGNRYAHQLSGGQQQRVALARALIYEPTVLLLDEPFGALDVRIRTQLRRSLKDIQRRLGVTTILVTHDQEEAFELGDRIGVLERGRLLDVGEGEQVYSTPRTLFTATFLGAGTVLVGSAQGGEARFGPLTVQIPPEAPHEEGSRVQLLFRPEQVVVSSPDPPPDVPVVGKGRIVEQTFAGSQRRLRLRLPRLAGARQIAPALPFGEEGLLVDALVHSDAALDNGELWVGLRGWTILEQPPTRLMVCDAGIGPLDALITARILSERLEATTCVLCVAENPDAGERLRDTLKQRQEEAGLVKPELHMRYGSPAEQILREQSESLYDIMVMQAGPAGSRVASRSVKGRSRLRKHTLSAVLEGAHTPVLMVPEAPGDLKRVLICTAAGEPGKTGVNTGGQLARRLGAEVTLLHVIRPTVESDVLARNHLERAAATLRALDVPTQIHLEHASAPAAGILAAARKDNQDLVVIGSHGPHGRRLFGLNDVTLEVLSRADRPVLVVPPEEAL